MIERFQRELGILLGMNSWPLSHVQLKKQSCCTGPAYDQASKLFSMSLIKIMAKALQEKSINWQLTVFRGAALCSFPRLWQMVPYSFPYWRDNFDSVGWDIKDQMLEWDVLGDVQMDLLGLWIWSKRIASTWSFKTYCTYQSQEKRNFFHESTESILPDVK